MSLSRRDVLSASALAISSNVVFWSYAALAQTSSDELQAKFGYIYLGMRDRSGWVNNNYAFGAVISSDDIPTNGDVVQIVQPVHLREGVPPSNAHLVMRADLGVLQRGQRVRIKTVTRLDPEGFYWASVYVL